MDKAKIFRYELRRVVFSKPFLFITALTLIYALYLLKTDILFGYADTAPFSAWSFLAYLCRLLPFLCALALFFVSRQTAPREKAVEVLAQAAPTPAFARKAVKLLAVAAAVLAAAALAMLAHLLFAALRFHYTALGWTWALAALVLLPQLFLFMGVGLWLGKVHCNLVYVLVVVLFFVAFTGFTMPAALDLFGSGILAGARQGALTKGVIPFTLPQGYLASRVIIFLAGAGLGAGACLAK